MPAKRLARVKDMLEEIHGGIHTVEGLIAPVARGQIHLITDTHVREHRYLLRFVLRCMSHYVI